MTSDLYARANAAADMEKLAGTPLKRQGRHLRGECPLCGASKGKKTGGAFTIDLQTNRWKCWACLPDKMQSAVDLAAALWSCTPREAAEQLAGASPSDASPARVAKPAPVREVKPDDDRWAAELAADLWKGAAPAARTPVETYLRSRGLFGPVLEEALRRLRFHPAAYHSGPAREPVRLPAMVAIVHAPGPEGLGVSTGGVHVTYLAPDGRAKTHRDPAKKMWGPQARDGQPGGAWLAAPTGAGELIVAEGIESALSAAILCADEAPGPRRVVAALSLGRLQGGLASDRFGRRDPDMPTPDPDSPAFTWPDAGAVVVAVDRDMRPVTVKARKATGGTYDRRVDGDERARICGALACAAWKRAGASAARTIAPEPGRDFNDELRARLAAGTVGRAA